MFRQVPGSHQINTQIIAPADAVQGEGEAAEGLLDGVFVAHAYVGCAGFRQGNSIGVGEEGGEVMVVLGGSGWWRWEFEEAAGERGEGWCVMEDCASGESARLWLFFSC